MSSNFTSDTTIWQGWVETPDQRGTLDIIWSCVATLYLCLFTMLHLNVPASTDSAWNHVARKIRWTFLGLLAPELPMLFACGQWASARRSVESMRAMGHNSWTVEHGFYADMGGFVLQAADHEPFPLSAKLVEHLVRHAVIPVPDITQNEIRDKSKADGITRLVTCVQAGSLLLQVIGRAAEGLPITPLELSTLCIAGCSFTTLWFWRKKPLDVITPTNIVTDRGVAEIMEKAGSAAVAAGTFTDTPLDFVEPEAYMSRKWSRRVLRCTEAAGLQTTPMQRVPNDRDPQVPNLTTHVWLGAATAAFASIHFEAWNAEFPTDWERTLWRASCLAIWALLAVYGSAEVVACWREDCKNLGLDTLGGYKRRFPACLWFFVPASLYVGARIFILFESAWCMRSMPPDVFVTVSWAEYIPHM